MANSNYQNEKQFEPWMAKNDFYSLSKVFGFGSKNNYSISYSKENGLISWIAGPYVILYDVSKDKQVSFIKNPNNKIISCLRFSDSGTLLSTGEGNCKNGEIRIYEISYNQRNEEVKFNSILNYKIHKYGIDKIFFFRNDSYILSIGNNEDKSINIMDIHNKQVIFTSKFNRPILACDVSDDFMIMCGNGFIKLYNYKKLLECENEDEIKNKNLMSKSLVELSKLKNRSFISVVIDKYNNNSEEKKVFFMTYDCYLVEMKSSSYVLNRWVHLKSSKGISLIMWNNYLGCGCGDGVYRIFTNELKYISTLKMPPPLGEINSDKEIVISNNKNNSYAYADIIASLYNSVHNKLIVVYSDKTFITWNINNFNNIQIYNSKVFHCGGIKAMDYFIDKKNNLVKIATCSDDKTVIFWNIPTEELIQNQTNYIPNQHIFYSNYIKHVFYLRRNFESFKVKEVEILSNSYNLSQNKKPNNNENIDNEDEEYNLTSIRFSPCGNYISVGDSFGNINIFSLIDYKTINKIEAHNGEINTLDMINDQDNNKLYLSSGSSDNLVSLIDMSDGLYTDPTVDDKTIMEKMSSPVISVVFCIDKNKRLKLIVGEQNSTITFFLISNGILQTLQKNYDKNLKTYCLSYSPAIKKIISGHNGKISIWKTSTNIAHKHFQVNKGDKLLDNFRIASDNNGLILATSNDDKFIRVRALHDGKLLAKIQVSESISSLFFVLEDNYLIASSIEGYLYIFKLNKDLIHELKKDNLLKNSTEERSIITNKLLLLQKFMESDTSLSNNNQVKNLLKKFQQSEETTIDDLKLLDGFVKEGKKNLNNKKPKEIELKEEKATDYDEQENNQNEFLNKSNIFEKGLRNRITSIDTHTQKKNFGRISLTDNYITKLSLQFNKKKENENDINDKNEMKEEFNKKLSNININEEYSNNEINNINNTNKDEIKEEIEETPSTYQANIIDNSQTQLSESHINNLKITQTGNYDIKSFNFRTIKKGYSITKENDIYFEPRKEEKILSINKINNIELINRIEPKDKLIKSIDDNIINNITDENDLKEIETNVEKLLSDIRYKIGKEEKDPFMEKMVDKYSQLILEKINNNNKKSNINNNNNLSQDKFEEQDLL